MCQALLAHYNTVWTIHLAAQKSALVFVLLLLSVWTLKSKEVVNLTSPQYGSSYGENTFMMWDVKAPPGFVIFAQLRILDIADDFIYIGDGADQFSMDNNSCSRWRLLDNSSREMNFTSISYSVIIIFTSNSTDVGDGFYVDLRPIRLEDNRIHDAGG